MTKLPAIFQYLWLILLKNVVARNIGANLDLPVSQLVKICFYIGFCSELDAHRWIKPQNTPKR
jgi:hypothetical protein